MREIVLTVKIPKIGTITEVFTYKKNEKDLYGKFLDFVKEFTVQLLENADPNKSPQITVNPQTWFTKAVIKDLNKIIKSSEMGENSFCLNFLK